MVDVNYLSALLEEVRDQNKAVLEAVGLMQENVKKIPIMAEQIEKIEQDIKVIKLVVTDTNKQLQAHEKRITKLESAVQT